MLGVGVLTPVSQLGGARIILWSLEHHQGMIGAGHTVTQLSNWIWFLGRLSLRKPEVAPWPVSILSNHYHRLCIGECLGMPLFDLRVSKLGNKFPALIG